MNIPIRILIPDQKHTLSLPFLKGGFSLGLVVAGCLKNPRRLTENNIRANASVFSLKDDNIVATIALNPDETELKWEIFTMAKAGSNKRRLTFNGQPELWPRWFPK